MRVVIEIPDKVYTYVKRGWEESKFDSVISHVFNGIINGVVLPEHHGRLIDADWVKNTLDIYVINEYNGQFIRRSDIDKIPTIIEGSESE